MRRIDWLWRQGDRIASGSMLLLFPAMLGGAAFAAGQDWWPTRLLAIALFLWFVGYLLEHRDKALSEPKTQTEVPSRSEPAVR